VVDDFEEFARKLRLTAGQRVAVVNAPPACALLFPAAGLFAADHADAVIGFATRRTDLALLDPVYAAACSGRLACIEYPNLGQLGTDVGSDWLAKAVCRYGVEPIEHVWIDLFWSVLLLRPAEDAQAETRTVTTDRALPYSPIAWWPHTPGTTNRGPR
jgi:hypothetical protein